MLHGICSSAEGGGAEPLIPVPIRSTLESFTDQEIREVSENLSRAGRAVWSRTPRLYVVLCLIKQTQILDAFIAEEITDLSFPFTQHTLPLTFSDQTARKDFLEKQYLVRSTILELERGTKHHHFARDSDVPLVKLSNLGNGGFGHVDRVRSEVSFQEYARKLIPRGCTFKKDKKVLKDFENELHHLRKLSHRHIVRLVGSYTDPCFVGLIMSPIAECNLKQYLNGSFEPSLVRTFFGCLATAVRFLHESCVRHKDIKPENVLVHRGSVLLNDFGISRDWTDAGHSTTTGPTIISRRYCAPEVGDESPRNSSSDIWSLGCIFLEMWTVVSGHSLDLLFKHLEGTGTRCSFYHLNPTGVLSWYKFAWPNESNPSGPLLWIQNMLRMEREERWLIQMLSDCIQEHSESGTASFIGLCCDNRIGSPETVNSVPDEQTIIQANASHSGHSPVTDNPTIGSLDLGDLILTTSSRLTGTTGHGPVMSDGHSVISQQDPQPLRNSSKRRLAPTIAKSTSRKRRPSQSLESSKGRSQPTGTDLDTIAGFKTGKVAGHHKRDFPLPDGVQKALPSSFLVAQNNRFTREEILRFTAISQDPHSRTSRSTRLSRGSEKVLFSYGDYMLPTVVYAETCIRSKPSQYARWSTLKSLVEHMTPGILRGYVRLCPDMSEGMASIPAIIPTGSPTDEVDGMLLFGYHDSHAEGSRKYESKYEHDVQDLVTLELKNGSKMEVEASFRVWNEDQRDALSPFSESWKPLHLVDGEWYALVPLSATAEDEELRDMISRNDMRVTRATGSSRMSGLEQAFQEEGMMEKSSAPRRPGSGGEGGLNMTKNLISELFYNEARYFVLKDTEQERIETCLEHGIWSSTPSVNSKLDRAFKSSGTSPIILFIVLAGEGLFGMARMASAVDRSDRDHSWMVPRWKLERFHIEWCYKSPIPFSHFLHIRMKDNFEGSNESACVTTGQNGTELSQLAGTEMLRVFETLHGSPSNPSATECTVFEDRWTVLMNPQSSVAIDLKLVRAIPLDSEDGDYGITINSDGKYVAAGCRVIEVFSVETGLRVWRFSLPNGSDEIHGASFNHDSTRLAVGGECGVIYVWNLQSELLAGTLTGHTGAIFSLEYMADGSRIVSGSEDHTVRVWDAHLLTSYVILPVNEGCVTISSSPDCSHVFTGTLSGKLMSWQINSNSEMAEASAKKIQIHDDSTYCIQYMPKLNGIVTGSRDKSVKLWSTSTIEQSSQNGGMRQPSRKFLGHMDSVYSVDVSPDNKIIFSASGDGSLRLWNSETGEAIATILGFGRRRFHDLSVCQTVNLFTAAGHGEGLQLWSYKVLPERNGNAHSTS